MTKKDYEMIALWVAAMHTGIARYGDITLKCTFPHWVDGIADDLAADNPKFNRARFMHACGVTEFRR